MTELIIGELYKIKYSNVIYDQTFKLIKKHEPIERHDILFTFLDQNNNTKTMFTNGLINDGKIIITPIEKKDYVIVQIENNELSQSNAHIYRNHNAYLSTILDDHDIYG
jgi:hypothetical protein